MAALTGICYIAQTHFPYTNPSSSSQTRIPSAAAADEGFSHAETRVPHTCHSHLLRMSASAHSLLLEAVGFEKARAFSLGITSTELPATGVAI